MQAQSLSRCASTLCVAAAMLAGCGGSQPPIDTQGVVPQTSAIARHTARGKSWMLPEARKAKRLLYISDARTNNVFVYNYYTRLPVGTLTGFSHPAGQCVDAKGDVWIPNFSGTTILEYRHGGVQPVKTLTTDTYVQGCSVSPNGDLAVDAKSPESSYGDELQVWHNASGSPTNYVGSARCSYMSPPGYDGDGNLFVETNFSGDTNVCEVAAGSDRLQLLFVQRGQICCGSVMWDGRHITLTQPREGQDAYIFRVKQIDSYDLKVVGYTKLTGKCDNGQTETPQPFIVGQVNTPVNHEEGTVVVSGNALCHGVFNYWHYPHGLHRFLFLRNAPAEPTGESVSIRVESER